MWDLTRRTMLKSSAAAGGVAVASKWLFDGDELVTQVNLPTRAPAVEDSVFTTCWIGKQDCGISARRVDGRVVKLEGAPGFPRNDGTLCPKGRPRSPRCMTRIG